MVVRAIKNISQFFLFLYCLLYIPFCILGKVLKPVCFTLNVRDLPMNKVFISREKWFLLQLLFKSQVQVYNHGKDLCCFSACVCLML